MNWILIGLFVLLAQKQNHATSIYRNPIHKQGQLKNINPFIKHWEAANFNRVVLDEAHQMHINQQERRRRKRDINAGDYGTAHTIKLNFFAHDREFRLILRQNPRSIFVPDIEIENTLGPIDYDVSRVYTGSLEDDENSHVHAILTRDNLLDGTIETASENFYMEPAHRYSHDLPKAGVHSIVYKLSDVRMHDSSLPGTMSSSGSATTETTSTMSTFTSLNDYRPEYCASELLRKKQQLEVASNEKDINRDEKHLWRWQTGDRNDDKIDDTSATRTILQIRPQRSRHKRWLPDELPGNRNPPLPLDLEVPYNDESNLFSLEDLTVGHINDKNLNEEHQNRKDIGGPDYNSNIYTKTNHNRNIIVNDYNPNSDFNLRSRFNHNSNDNYRNILVNTFNSSRTNSNTNLIRNNFNNFFNASNSNDDNAKNGNTNSRNSHSTSISSISNSSSTSRPSHKTHVEIITRNGATKKPNILVNNYNPPDVILTSQNYHHINLNVRNELDYGMSRSLYERKSTCMLYLQADHTFFNKMGSDEASIEAITRHVQRANAIYRNTDFNGDGKPDNITFMIKRIKVHNNNALKDPSYRFPGNYGVEKFLELFSEEDYDAFCLAYMFTYRDFEMGTLGLAWTGDLKNAGGVCEKNGHYRGSLKSLNTGIVTLLNYGKHVPPAVSHVTLAHEIGHNFGSPHDPELCTPGGEDGNYIMFARATSGDKKNNNKFSPCSLKSIEPVLNAKARSAKGCFTEPQRSICGNGVVEPGEQCDCGWEEDCKDSCCFPMSRHPRPDEKPCTLTPRALCSPSQGPCCTNECSLKFGNKCRDDNGCRDPSFCDGRMPQCPPSVFKPNKTICNKEFVCYMGECTGSICLAYGLESCQCIPGPNDPKTKSCELCCKLPGEDNPCKSSFEWNELPYDVPDMFSKPGTPCNDYNGYCDVFQKCREVDPSGPLATLRKLLLSEESIATFKNWLESNWYIVAVAFAGVITILVILVKLFGKRPNLKLKSVTIIHSATTETVRLPEDNNGVIVHTAVRTKVPFKKKVRGERSKSKIAAKAAATAAAAGQSTKTTIPIANSTTHAANTSAGNSKGISVLSGKVTKRSSELLKRTNRKKNRISTPNDETQKNANAAAAADSKSKKKTKKLKEVIDYSANASTHTNTFGRVHKWLLESPLVAQPFAHIEHTSKVRKVIAKSQSTPERLVQQSPKKSKSLGNLSNEKVKLQVVYKPPFKFSLKLSKNSAVKTHVLGGALKKNKRKTRTGDKKRVAAAPSSSGNNSSNPSGGRRAALLIQTQEDEMKKPIVDSEPNYETLNPKSKDNEPHYQNMKIGNSSGDGQFPQTSVSQDAATSALKSSAFRINRSSSNNRLDNQNPTTKPQASSYGRSNSITNTKPQSRQQQSSHSRRNSASNSTNLNRNFGSTQNLIPSSSSQGHLSKLSKKRSSLNLKANSPHELGRSNTASNLIGSRHQSGSVASLKRETSSSNINLKGGNLSRNSSNSNLKSSSLTRGSISNIPRASLNNSPTIGGITPPVSFARQLSHHQQLQSQPLLQHQQSLLQQPPLSQQQHHGLKPLLPLAPMPATNNFNLNHSHSTSSFSHNATNNASPGYSHNHHHHSGNGNNYSNHNSGNSSSHSYSNNAATSNFIRPHTATCDEVRHFEWPKSLVAGGNSSSGCNGFSSSSGHHSHSHSSGSAGGDGSGGANSGCHDQP